MNFSEQAPSNEWTAVKREGEEIAVAWFKPEGEPFTLVFRVPQERFEVDDLSQQLTLEDLLTAAAISNEEVESWQHLDESHSGMDGTNPELKRLLPSPPSDATHLTVAVRLKLPAARAEGGEQDVPPEKWQALEALWRAILGIEAGIDSLRHSMESLRNEMEAEFRRSLAAEDKLHALQADVALWNKAKSRVHYALPKAREFIHRATWAQTVPERKRLEELFRTHIEPRASFPQMDQEREKLEHLQKDRQVLAAQGATVYHECRGITSEIQRTLSTLRRNAADRARGKRSTSREKGKYF
ncbi:MAG TPA: hypothetical protein VFG68_01300 [Fimbriiglobus sp.]|nr:hypothetical protein [Fimbriiglobus sp.]